MAHKHRIVQPSRIAGTVLTEEGERLTPPSDWAFLAAGDAAITRSVKAKGPSWVVQIRKGRRMISRGVWAKESYIIQSQEEVAAKRATPAYTKRLNADRARRSVKQMHYIGEFHAAVLAFLNFHLRYKEEARLMAEKITAHATPVGSGTVARTTRIPIEKRAEAASIAWMRHETTAYDSMRIARIKGKRREVRRALAAQSVTLLQAYRQGGELTSNCPLCRALNKNT
jgi:hypothetical protein